MARVPLGEMAGTRILRRYVHGISVVPKGRTSSFACKFLTSFQVSVRHPNCIRDYAGRLLGPVTLDEAEVHSERTASPLTADLAIAKRDHWYACAAIAIFLREEDIVFGKCFERLPAEGITAVKDSRVAILKRIRFYLMARPDIHFIAVTQLTTKGTSNQSQNGVIEGFGAVRFGVSGYSHLAREMLLFILIDTLLKARANDPIQRKTLDAIIANLTAERLNDKPTSLFDSVLLPFFSDLKWSTTRANMASTTHVQYDQQQHAASHLDACATPPPKRKEIADIGTRIREMEGLLADIDIKARELPKLEDLLRRKRDEREKLCDEERRAVGDIDAYAKGEEIERIDGQIRTIKATLDEIKTKVAERPWIDDLLRRKTKERARTSGRMLTAMQSRPLQGAGLELQRDLELLTSFVNSVEECGEHLRKPRAGQALFKNIFRLRFALGLMSFRREEKFNAEHHVQVLGAMFDLTNDSITGDALAFIQGNSAREPWGIARPDGQYFYGVLQKLAEEHLQKLAKEHTCTPFSSPQTVRHGGVESLLAAIDADLRQQFLQYLSQRPRIDADLQQRFLQHLSQRPSIDATNGESDLYIWAFVTHQCLPACGFASSCFKLRALCEMLTDLLVAAPDQALLHCVLLANEALPKNDKKEPPLVVPPPSQYDGMVAFRNRIKTLLDDPDRLVNDVSDKQMGALNLLDELMTKVCLQAAAAAQIKKPNATNTPAADGGEKTRAKFIFDFFTEKYAASQAVADRDRWEYLAYRLTQTVKTQVYARIYALVSHDIVTKLPAPLKDLQATYDYILRRPEFKIAMSDLYEKLELAQPPGSHHG